LVRGVRGGHKEVTVLCAPERVKAMISVLRCQRNVMR
jgi:hypothetical protein